MKGITPPPHGQVGQCRAEHAAQRRGEEITCGNATMMQAEPACGDHQQGVQQHAGEGQVIGQGVPVGQYAKDQQQHGQAAAMTQGLVEARCVAGQVEEVPGKAQAGPGQGHHQQ